MTKAVKELVQAAEEAIGWMEDLTLPNEFNPDLQRIKTAVEAVKAEDKTSIRTGFLLLIEHANGHRRITATVECREKYMSRVGWASADVDADVTYSEEVNDLEWARDDLKTLLDEERWGSKGMIWSETPREDLIAAMKTVAESVNNHRT